jgi:hypothetical protein
MPDPKFDEAWAIIIQRTVASAQGVHDEPLAEASVRAAGVVAKRALDDLHDIAESLNHLASNGIKTYE